MNYETNYELHNYMLREQICQLYEKKERVITWSQSETCVTNPEDKISAYTMKLNGAKYH